MDGRTGGGVLGQIQGRAGCAGGSEDRQGAYQAYLENDPHSVEYVTSVNDLLARSIVEPPLALLVDVRTKIRLGTRETNIIDNLQVDWPILRGRTMTEGIQASCTKPSHTGDLEVCLDAIWSQGSIEADLAKYAEKKRRREASLSRTPSPN